MTQLIETINSFLALGGIGLFLGAVVLVVDLYTSRSLESLIKRYGLLLALLLTLAGSALTLVYSEIFGFIPCGLCWLQRVFLYPQVFIFGAAILVKDRMFAPLYGIILSVLGLLVALYQHYLQMGGGELITCPTTGAGADCAERIMFEYGFMTFPLVSAATFVFLIALYYYLRKMR